MTFRTSGITQFGVCYHILHPLRLVWWCCGEFPALRSRWNSTFNASTFIAFMTYDNNTPDWLNKLLFYILHKSANLSSTEICLFLFGFATKFFIFFFISHFPPLFCVNAWFSSAKKLCDIAMSFHTLYDQIISTTSYLYYLYFFCVKTCHVPDLKTIYKFTFKLFWSQNDSLRENRTARFGLTSSTKANRSIGHVHWNIKLNIYPSQRRNRDLQTTYSS